MTKTATMNMIVICAGNFYEAIRGIKHIKYTNQYLLGEGRRTDGIGITVVPRHSRTLVELEEAILKATENMIPWDWGIEMSTHRDIFGYEEYKTRRLMVRIKKKRE